MEPLGVCERVWEVDAFEVKTANGISVQIHLVEVSQSDIFDSQPQRFPDRTMNGPRNPVILSIDLVLDRRLASDRFSLDTVRASNIAAVIVDIVVQERVDRNGSDIVWQGLSAKRLVDFPASSDLEGNLSRTILERDQVCI